MAFNIDPVPAGVAPVAAYIHIPFCISKCKYCDFNSYPGLESYFDKYTDAVLLDISGCPPGQPLSSIYFGGGTPTCLGYERLIPILLRLENQFGVAEDCEIAVEANPGTITPLILEKLHSAGYNRISLGVQSFNDRFLQILGRAHDSSQTYSALDMIQSSGFSSLSLDLMYGLPGQSLDDWICDLQAAVKQPVQHISAYELTIESGTQMATSVARGELELPDEDVQIEMMLAAEKILRSAGFKRYEISNYCLPGYECRHNLVYWHNEPYYGFGAGATGYYAGIRYTHTGDPVEYINRILAYKDTVEIYEKIDGELLEAETLMMGFRLADGIESGVLDRMSETTREKAYQLIGEGMLKLENGMIKATPEGYVVLNDISARFLP